MWVIDLVVWISIALCEHYGIGFGHRVIKTEKILNLMHQ